MQATAFGFALAVVAVVNLFVGAAALLPSQSPEQFRSFCVPVTCGMLALSVPFLAAGLL
jgi:hypothetical protein